MPAFKQEVEEADGWTYWIQPVTIRDHGRPYKMACCDCGLVHDVDLRTFYDAENETDRAEMRVRRNNRSTGQIRRHIKAGL